MSDVISMTDGCYYPEGQTGVLNFMDREWPILWESCCPFMPVETLCEALDAPVDKYLTKATRLNHKGEINLLVRRAGDGYLHGISIEYVATFIRRINPGSEQAVAVKKQIGGHALSDAMSQGLRFINLDSEVLS